MNKNTLVSVCSVLQDCETFVEDFIRDVSTVLKDNFEHYEIVLLDNGSSDGTASKVKDLLTRYKKVRLVILARKYPRSIALTAALENAIGDFVVLMDANDDPSSLLTGMVQEAIVGANIVTVEFPPRPDDTFLYGLFRAIFFWISNVLAEHRMETNWSDFVCFSRKMVNHILQTGTSLQYLKYLNTEIGYTHKTLKGERIRRSPLHRVRHRFWPSFFLGVDVLVAHSGRILRLATSIALATSGLSFSYFIYTIAIYLFKSHVAEGWTTISLVLSVMFTVLFFILFILGEYASLIYREIKKGPQYHIANESDSSVIFEGTAEKNVV